MALAMRAAEGVRGGMKPSFAKPQITNWFYLEEATSTGLQDRT